MNTTAIRSTFLLAAAVAFAVSLPVHAAVIVNGGFESGFTGWARADQTGSDGTFRLQTVRPAPSTAILYRLRPKVQRPL